MEALLKMLEKQYKELSNQERNSEFGKILEAQIISLRNEIHKN